MTTTRRATSIDVAALAGVSQPTVSRALRGDTTVSSETRERVARVARELNYTLDRRAARLRSNSTGNVALVLLTAPGEDRAALNPLYFALLGAVGAAASDRGYNLLVSFQDGPGTFRADFAQTREADGTIVIGSAQHAAGWRFFGEAAAADERVVGWGAPNDALPTIRCDKRAGAAAAVEHLLAQGRARIGFVGPGWRRHKAYRDRRAGYLETLAARGIAPIESLGSHAGSREDQGGAIARDLLDRHPECDAMFAACDTLALGAIRALRGGGRAVPGDVAVVGFDGIATAAHVRPALTTVEQDSRAAGRLLVEALLDLIAGRPPTREAVPMRLIVRESCGATTPHAGPSGTGSATHRAATSIGRPDRETS